MNRYHYFRTMRGFIVLPADWQSKKFFSDEELVRIHDMNILEGATPVLVDEYDLCCVAIRKNQVACIAPESECILFIESADKKALSYIADYGVYEEIEDAMLDFSRNEYSRIFDAITSVRGAFIEVSSNLADLGYQFNLTESLRQTKGTTVWYNGATKLVMKYNHTNTVTQFELVFAVGTYEKVLTPDDYGVDANYAKEYLDIAAPKLDEEDDD